MQYQKPLDCIHGSSQSASQRCGSFLFTLLTIRGKMIIAGVAQIPVEATHTHTRQQQQTHTMTNENPDGVIEWSVHWVIDGESADSVWLGEPIREDVPGLTRVLQLRPPVEPPCCTMTEVHRLPAGAATPRAAWPGASGCSVVTPRRLRNTSASSSSSQVLEMS